MENFENNLKEQKREMMRQKIAELKQAYLERKEKGGKYNPHFEIIDPDKLTDVDLGVFEKFIEETLTEKEFRDYLTSFENMKDQESDPRFNFKAWMANQLCSPEWMERFQKEK